MPGRTLILYLLILTTGCSGMHEEQAGRSSGDDPPNIIVILSDDQGWGDFSFTGNTNIETPAIDRLGKEGVYFENFYVQPVCSPTRAEFLTGRYAARSGVYDTSEGGERIDLDETTIAGIFKEAGYATAAYGKWHSGMQYPYHPNGRGFDDFFGFCSGHWGNYFSPMLEHNGEIVDGNGYLPDDLTDHGLAFIEQNKDNPFFLYLPYNTPHDPLQVPDAWYERFAQGDLTMRADTVYNENLEYTRAVLAMCENIDWNVGRILDKLEELGLENNTIVVYFNDNGPNAYRWNGGMRGRKGSTDEGGTRSPLFMRWPGHIPSGKTISGLSAAIDLLPTLAQLAGVGYRTGKPLDGISLVPQLTGGDPEGERYIVNQWSDRISIRDERYRLDHSGRLYDITADRGQHRDIRDENPEVFRNLSDLRDRYMEEVMAELPAVDKRTFPLGHPGSEFTQLPARDGKPHGHIKRSNRWPNCSFFTDWKTTDDEITWEVEVMEEGTFEVVLYYTCKAGNEGSVIELRMEDVSVQTEIREVFDPPLRGMENDRVPRENSYVKDFKPVSMGKIHLKKGNGVLRLRALEIPGEGVIDVRLLMFRRTGS